jgi:hypothetical protein
MREFLGCLDTAATKSIAVSTEVVVAIAFGLSATVLSVLAIIVMLRQIYIRIHGGLIRIFNLRVLFHRLLT